MLLTLAYAIHLAVNIDAQSKYTQLRGTLDKLSVFFVAGILMMNIES